MNSTSAFHHTQNKYSTYLKSLFILSIGSFVIFYLIFTFFFYQIWWILSSFLFTFIFINQPTKQTNTFNLITCDNLCVVTGPLKIPHQPVKPSNKYLIWYSSNFSKLSNTSYLKILDLFLKLNSHLNTQFLRFRSSPVFITHKINSQ